MDNTIVPEALVQRKSRALAIAAEGMVSPNGLDGQYYVDSQSRPGVRYIASSRRVTDGALVCCCADTWARSRGIPCKHILAAEYYESAEEHVLVRAERHGLTLDQLEGPLSASDYMTWTLNQIFTPARWSFAILSGPDLVRLNDTAAYIQVTGRLEVTFADGCTVNRDGAGAWLLVATKNNGSLDNTAPERYETALKATVSDALKACAERLGVCFRPLIDRELHEHIFREQFRRESAPVSAAQATAGLFGEDAVTAPADQEKADGDARAEFYTLSGQAIRDGVLTAPEVNDLVKKANGDGGWATALAALKARLN
jgi:hypothetical protein